MKGIAKVIDELGMMILAKNIELEQKKEEIERLEKKVAAIEQYLDTYESYFNQEHT